MIRLVWALRVDGILGSRRVRGPTGPGAPLAQFTSKPLGRILRVDGDAKPLALCFEPCHLAGWRHGCLLSRAQGRLLVYGPRWCCPGLVRERILARKLKLASVSYMPLASLRLIFGAASVNSRCSAAARTHRRTHRQKCTRSDPGCKTPSTNSPSEESGRRPTPPPSAAHV